MKKQIRLLLTGSIAALLLCGCKGGPVNVGPDAGADTGTVSSAAPQSGSPEAQSSIQGSSAAGSLTEESSDGSSEVQSSTPAAEETSQESEQEHSSEQTSSQSAGESSAGSKTESSAESKAESSNAEVTPEPENSGEEQEITPREYIDPLKITVDISDKEVAAAKTDLSDPQVYYITNTTELHNFYEKYKTAYSLDKVDGGLSFNEAVSTLDGTFFKDNDAVIIVQQYDKDKEITIGDVYKQGGGSAVDIYKEEPTYADHTAYVLDIIGALRSDLGGKTPQLCILPAGGYITEEGDSEDEAEIIEE